MGKEQPFLSRNYKRKLGLARVKPWRLIQLRVLPSLLYYLAESERRAGCE